MERQTSSWARPWCGTWLAIAAVCLLNDMNGVIFGRDSPHELAFYVGWTVATFVAFAIAAIPALWAATPRQAQERLPTGPRVDHYR